MKSLKEIRLKLREYGKFHETQTALKEGKSLLLTGEPSTKKCISANQLKNCFQEIESVYIENSALCTLFCNGFALYDNFDRKTVINIENIETCEYYSNVLRQNFSVELENIPWAVAVCTIGEDRIWNNLEHPKSNGTVSDFDDFDNTEFSESYINTKIYDPETAYMRQERREAIHEFIRKYTNRNAEIYILHHFYKYKHREIAQMLGVSRQDITKRLKTAQKAIEKVRLVLGW